MAMDGDGWMLMATDGDERWTVDGDAMTITL